VKLPPVLSVKSVKIRVISGRIAGNASGIFLVRFIPKSPDILETESFHPNGTTHQSPAHRAGSPTPIKARPEGTLHAGQKVAGWGKEIRSRDLIVACS
jgi:hypothetical protein